MAVHARVKSAAQHCEPLVQERMDVLARDGTAGPHQEMGHDWPIAPVLGPAQDHGILARGSILENISAARHGDCSSSIWLQFWLGEGTLVRVRHC